MREKKKGDNWGDVYLFRHGKTDFNTKKMFTGWMDSKLTKEGIENAKTIAKKLKNKRIDVAIHTSLSRSKDTLKYTLELHPECKTVICDNRMIERSYGELQGLKHSEFIKNVGKELFSLGEYSKFFKGQKKEISEILGKKEYDIIHRGWNISAKNGESFSDVEKRVQEFIDWLKKYIQKEKINIAISAHGNSIRVFRKIIENRTEKTASKWNIPYEKPYIYNFKK